MEVSVEVLPGEPDDRLGVLVTEPLEVDADGRVTVYVPISMILAWARNIEAQTSIARDAQVAALKDRLGSDDVRQPECRCTGLCHAYDCPEWSLPL